MKTNIESVMIWDLLDEIRVTYKSGTKRWVDRLFPPKTVMDFVTHAAENNCGLGVRAYRMEEQK